MDASPATVPLPEADAPPALAVGPSANVSEQTPAAVAALDEPEPASSGASELEPPSEGSVPDAGVLAEPATTASPPAVSLVAPVGWANMPGLGVQTTSGGGAAPAVLARSAAELVSLAASPEPRTIAIEGSLDVPALELASNKTLFGIGAGATLRGGISIRGDADAFVENVIVSNLNVAAETSAVDGDGIQVSYAHHVWIDHVALRDAPDGLLDIVHASDFVTVSHSVFFYTAAAPDPLHRFAALIGHDLLNAAEDRGRLNVTWHHNWWAEGVTEALTGRYGGIHVFNNLFRSPGGSSVIAAGVESSWLVENNAFSRVAAAHRILTGSGATLLALANVYDAATGARDATAAGFEPPYAYALDAAIGLADRVAAEAGPH